MRPRRLAALLVLLPLLPGPGAVAAPPRVSHDLHLQSMFGAYGDAGRGDRWTGGDATYDLRLPDGRTIWIFGDTFLGTVARDHSRAPQTFIHNSWVVQGRDGRLGRTLYTRSGSADRALVSPSDGQTFYWPTDATVEGSTIRQFLLRVAGAGPEFSVVGVDIASFDAKTLALKGIVASPGPYLPSSGGAGQVHYGSALTETAAYLYVWGTESVGLDKYLHVARVPRGHLLDKPWQYWSGTAWSASSLDSARLLSRVADELSVVQTAKGFRLVTSDDGVGATVVLYTAPRPEGPWSRGTVLFTTPESNAKTVTYNAKEHPDLDGRDHIVISYNVNAQQSNANGDYTDVDNYRPRFVDVYLAPDLTRGSS